MYSIQAFAVKTIKFLKLLDYNDPFLFTLVVCPPSLSFTLFCLMRNCQFVKKNWNLTFKFNHLAALYYTLSSK